MGWKPKIGKGGNFKSGAWGAVAGELLLPGVGGIIGGSVFGSNNKVKDKYFGKRDQALGHGAEAPESTLKDEIQTQIDEMPTHEISDEANQRLALLQQGATDLRETGQENTDIARSKTGMVMAPGSSQAMSDIKSATSQQVQGIAQMSGSASALGALSQVELNEQTALKDFAKSNLAYRSQSETGLMSALRNQSQLESQAASLETQGLEGMIAEKDKVYQSQLNKDLTSMQFDITKLGMEQTKRAADEEARSGLLGGLFKGMF